ncbi:unnamed protein product, partial [Oppiella nova]
CWISSQKHPNNIYRHFVAIIRVIYPPLDYISSNGVFLVIYQMKIRLKPYKQYPDIPQNLRSIPSNISVEYTWGTVQLPMYLATDDPYVWELETTPYREKGYVFKGNPLHSMRAQTYRRFTDTATVDLISDVWMLSECDHIVCTLSS